MLREMIFEHPFGDNFCDNFVSHTHIIFYFISLLLWFPCQYYFFFVNYGYKINCHQIGCSNTTPLMLIYLIINIEFHHFNRLLMPCYSNDQYIKLEETMIVISHINHMNTTMT